MSSNTQATFTKEQLKDDLLVDRLKVPNTVIIGAASEDGPSIVEIGKEYESLYLYHKALAWYRIAADRNSWSAISQIGQLYENGFGVTQNYYTAFEWYLKAARLSKSAGREAIGDMFRHGKGVPVNYYKAIEWYLKSKDVDDKIKELANHSKHIDAMEDKSLSLLINETEDIIKETKDKHIKQLHDQHESLIMEKRKIEEESNMKNQKIQSLKQTLQTLQSAPTRSLEESKSLHQQSGSIQKEERERMTNRLMNTEEMIVALQQGLNYKEQALLSFENKLEPLRQSLSRNKALKKSKAELERELQEQNSKNERLKQEIETLRDEPDSNDNDTVDLLNDLLQSKKNEIELVKENTRLLLLHESQRATLLQNENRELKMKVQECGDDATHIKVESVTQYDTISKKPKLSHY